MHGIYQASPNSIVSGNIIHDVGSHGIQVYGDSPGNETIYGNTVYNAAIGISSFFGTGNKIYNNVVYRIGAYGLWIADSSSLWANNTVYSNSSGIEIATVYSSGNTIKNNITYQNSTNITSCGFTHVFQ